MMWLLKHGHGPTGFDKVEHLFKDECLLGLYDLNSVNLSSATFITFAKTMINIRQRNPEIVRVSNDGAQSQPLKLAAEKRGGGGGSSSGGKGVPLPNPIRITNSRSQSPKVTEIYSMC